MAEKRRRTKVREDSVVVIGLGRFGSQVADSLVRLGHEVLAIDQDQKLVQCGAGRLTHVVQADATDSDTLPQLGVAEFPRAVVGIGTGIEASVLTVLTLAEIGVDDIFGRRRPRPNTARSSRRWGRTTSSIPKPRWATVSPT